MPSFIMPNQLNLPRIFEGIHNNLMTCIQGAAEYLKQDTEILKKDAEILKRDTKAIRASLEELHEKVDALPHTMLRLHEDTIPRFFIVLPEDGNWSLDSLFTRKLRLYFLCEHEHVEGSGKTKMQFHIAYHE